MNYKKNIGFLDENHSDSSRIGVLGQGRSYVHVVAVPSLLLSFLKFLSVP